MNILELITLKRSCKVFLPFSPNYGLAFGSGLAAIDAVIKLLSPGDEVISTNDTVWRHIQAFYKGL